MNYHGSCHCGRVSFEVQAKLDYVVECNCSICRRRGALWHGALESELRILTGEADLALCIDGVDAKSLPVRHFDGENWEAAAKAFLRPSKS
jgi:hypothetical protein